MTASSYFYILVILILKKKHNKCLPPFLVSSPGFADVQTLRQLCHLHLPLYLHHSDVCCKEVSMFLVFRIFEYLFFS